ncbi:MAG: hypothetical protein JW712_06465 [Dehalococcoidales bacterium]|nr:hypothetical protein [Dehalococcoidales bacterium]
MKSSIDENIPCYGWELEAAEYYLISGYDDTGYYYSGPGTGTERGPKLWHELGDSGTGLLEVYGITRGEPVDDAVMVRQTLEFALQHAENPEEWIFSGYRSGLAGWDLWIQTMENREDVNSFGVAYNAAVWAECRALGLKFLDEAKDRFPAFLSSYFDEAIECYFPVVDALSQVVSLFPMIPPEDGLTETERYALGITFLKQARQAEETALDSLREIVAVL